MYLSRSRGDAEKTLKLLFLPCFYMEFLDLDLGKVGFDEIDHFVEHARVMVRVGGEEGATEPGGLPDILQADFRGGEVKLFMQPREDGG